MFIAAANAPQSTIDGSGAAMAAIDPPAAFQRPDGGGNDRGFRAGFALSLRDASASVERAEEALNSMGVFLLKSKEQLEQVGEVQVLIDSYIVSNYIACEDVILEKYRDMEDCRPLRNTIHRLSLMIQNLVNLMVHTKAEQFERCLYELFKRYIASCYLTGDTERSRNAWHALLRGGRAHAKILQDVNLSMLYVETLVRRMNYLRDRDAEFGECFDDALRELSSWQVNPPDGRGRHVTDGPSDSDLKRFFGPHNQGPFIGETYRTFLNSLLRRPFSEPWMKKVHAVLQSLHRTREGLAPGEPVPAMLQLHPFIVSKLLINIVRAKVGSEELEDTSVLEETLDYLLTDFELHVHNQTIGQGGNNRVLPQFVDEGLVQQVVLMCERAQNSSLALRTLAALEKQLAQFPVGGPARPTTGTGVRVPSCQTYSGVIHAACADPDDGQLLRMLRVLGKFESAYVAGDVRKATSMTSLDPIRQLEAVAERLGRRPQSWLAAWEGIATLEKEQALCPTHFNVMIAALGKLPRGAQLPEEASGAPPSQPGSAQETGASGGQGRNSLVDRAAKLFVVLDEAYGDKLGVHTFNALLSVFCRPDCGDDATQYIMNTLNIMDKYSVTKSYETFELLMGHWAHRKVYGALLATAADMRAAGMRPPFALLAEAQHDAYEAGMHAEAQAVKSLMEELGYDFVPGASSSQRPRQIDQRGRVVSGAQ